METSEMPISVVIPVFNEELTIGNMIERLTLVMRKHGFKHEIIVVDDFSEDRSLEFSKSFSAKVFSLKMHMGKGYALRVGFVKAKGEIIATMDSDGSHRPEELPRLLAPIMESKSDLVIGSRYLCQTPVVANKLNVAGVRLFNFLIKILTRTTFSDSQSGFRVMTSAVLRSMRLKSKGYEIESEMLVKTIKHGFRVMEVPISYDQRTCGVSRLDPAIDGLKILFSIINALIRDGRN